MATKDVRGTRDDVRSKAPSTRAQKMGKVARLQREIDGLNQEIAALDLEWQGYVADRDARLAKMAKSA